jgi:nucleoid-associated protein EbfC
MNISKLLQQAQTAQARMHKMLAEIEVEGSAGGGLVRMRLNGLKELKGVTIEMQALTGEEAGLVADLVMAAWEDASRRVEERSREVLKTLGLPAGMADLF